MRHDDTPGLQQQVEQLQCEVEELRRTQVIDHALIETLAPGFLARLREREVPVALLLALRSSASARFQRVPVTIDDVDLHVLVDGAGSDEDPLIETALWTWLQEQAPTPPTHMFARATTPARLRGVAWPDGQMVVDGTLHKRELHEARRALRPRAPRTIVPPADLADHMTGCGQLQ